MSQTARVALVMAVLLGVPLLVVLLVSGSDSTVYRRDPGFDALAQPSPSPSTVASPLPSAVPIRVDPTELPAIAEGCTSDALLDEGRRRAAFRDALTAEQEGGGVSNDTDAWLNDLTDQLSSCRQVLGAGHSELRQRIEDTLEAVDAYREALAAPEDNSVSGAWSDLTDALDAVVEAWADAAA